MIFLNLFITFVYFGFLCLSGGSSLIQFYIDTLVNSRQWMSLEELGNLLAIAQVTPGPIGVNLATFIGYRQAGFFGGMLATVGLLAPSFFLMSLAVHSYRKWKESNLMQSLMFGIKPITVSLITVAIFACLGMSIFTEEIPFSYLCTFGAVKYEGAMAVRWEMLPVLIFAMTMLYFKKLSIMAVIFISAAGGIALHLLFG